MMNNCSWAVCYDIDGKYYDDKKTRTTITALSALAQRSQYCYNKTRKYHNGVKGMFWLILLLFPLLIIWEAAKGK